ncbi:hypothetical protein Ahu01nite_016020 [Winogradskya humida]|uniref:Uncharacterized protein n=1 Tax=Winogradskya humida TaxID=113566 RepID=A0ABQ3ZIT8_9ACTN|nr:hypothetical protein Ahu01nite_016020 [Actinoplanes humidus]
MPGDRGKGPVVAQRWRAGVVRRLRNGGGDGPVAARGRGGPGALATAGTAQWLRECGDGPVLSRRRRPPGGCATAGKIRQRLIAVGTGSVSVSARRGTSERTGE